MLYILIIAFILDGLLGDPRWLPHLIVLYGKAIDKGEKILNKRNYKVWKGALLVVTLVSCTYVISYYVLEMMMMNYKIIWFTLSILLLFYCLANRTLIKECVAVFNTLEKKGIEAGRERLSWIVGRDTSKLNEQQVRIATLETLSENLSDGVIAPLFYYFLLGVPGAMAYKMINTLDSMIGYKNERYNEFGKFAAKLDDVANIIPARLTALLILLVSFNLQGIDSVYAEGKKHTSPNAGYPEAALAFVLNCQFGGPNYYNGQLVNKPFIGMNYREIAHTDICAAARVNWRSSILFCLIYILASIFWYYAN